MCVWKKGLTLNDHVYMWKKGMRLCVYVEEGLEGPVCMWRKCLRLEALCV